MRFATRAFLCSFIPFALLLTVSFWLIQKSVLSTVRDGLRASLREAHAAVARVQAKSEIHNSRYLRVLGENSTLKAGLQLLSVEPDSEAGRLTLVDQVRELAETQGFDLLAISNPDGKPIGGVIREGTEFVPLTGDVRPLSQNGSFPFRGRMFQLNSVPVNLGDENVGLITVGELLDFSAFAMPAVLSKDGRVLHSTVPNVSSAELEGALLRCGKGAECEARLGGTSFLSLPIETFAPGDGFELRGFQDLDAASAPVQSILSRVFLIAGAGALLAALVLSVISTRSVLAPLAAVVRHLRESERTQVLPEFTLRPSPVPEIRELTMSFNQAAAAIREGQEYLCRAHFGFISSLASALDARDPYTAGHSHRVSRMATETAQMMGLPSEELDRIRVGALLHDIGKIGVPDHILQKPDALTREEFELIKQHPGIGRRILEPVGGFEDYLPIVELHHENWDGSGYPHGLRGESVPLGARIVHVVDCYDAITTDRPYRPGMSHEKAAEILRQNAGTQFDGAVIAAFLLTNLERGAAPETESIQSLAAAVGPPESTSAALGPKT